MGYPINSNDGCVAITQLHARDRFTLEGPESNQPVVLTARLHVEAEIACAGNCLANGMVSLKQGGREASSGYIQGASGAGDATLEIPCVLGQAFDLEVYAWAWSGYHPNAGGSLGYARLSASLDFTGLPAGYRLFSCQGRYVGFVVPALQSSWGSLKLHYR